MRSIYFALIIILFSCGQQDAAVEKMSAPQKSSIEQIEKLESEILDLPMNSEADAELLNESKKTLVDSLLAYYRNYSKDTLAPVYLDKVHMLYSGMGEYRLASTYADMILNQYPNYVNRKMVIESQIINYDIFIVPRNKEKVREYIELILKEPTLTEEERQEYKSRLENIDKSLLD